MSQPKVIAFFPEASYGAALNCVGIAQELRRLGARPVFICHPGFRGVFSEYGFPEYQLAVGRQRKARPTGPISSTGTRTPSANRRSNR